jgi:enoyl-CoA hydratase
MTGGALAYYTAADAIGEIVLDNPAKRNALNPTMLADIGVALDAFLADDSTRVAIVRGEGPSFCAGVDLSAGSRYGTMTTSEDHVRLQRMADLWLRFWDSPKPVITQIHGHCLAGALQLPLSCDIVAVAEDAVIGSPKLPAGGGWIGPMLAYRVGSQRAKLFALQIGLELSGREAYEWGFASVIAPAEQLTDHTRALAARIARTPADLLRIEKQSINSATDAAGFRSAVYTGTLFDAIAHTSTEVLQARARAKEIGLKQAIAEYRGGDGSV